MDTIKSFIASYTAPKGLTPEDGITYWQERILRTLLLAASGLGALTWAPSVYLSIKEELWMVAGADTLVLGYVLFLTLNPGLSYRARAAGMSIITYILGLILIFTLGPYGGGPLWIFLFPILTAVLLGPRASSWTLALNGATVVFIGFLIHQNRPEIMVRFGFKAWHLVQENPDMKWVVICANFMLLNILATVSVNMVLNGLQKSLLTLSVSRKKYRRIFDNILDVYFETSLDGTILEISPSIEQVCGYSRDELLGTPIHRLYHRPEKRQLFVEHIVRETHTPEYEIRLRDKTGKAAVCSANARLIRDNLGEPQKIIGILRDISEQKEIAKRKKELEERLNRSQKMEALGLLAGGVAHDLNNVLSGIVTYPDLLLMDIDENSPMGRGLQTIQASGLRATEIVQDLLTLSRRGVVSREVVDLNTIVREFLRTPEYEKILSFHPNVTVTTDLSAGISRLRGSDIHLQKTVMNLISNAAEAQPHGGIIRITTVNRRLDRPLKGYGRVMEGDVLILSVEDRGEGIAQEDLKRIFEPFFTKKVMGRSGTGLGMAVVWGTVQDHDGYIDVTSSPGRGTRFDLYFPVTRDLPETASGAVPFERLAGQGERILIVDDDAHQRQIASGLLERLNYTVFTAENGETAVSLLKDREADLVLLDMIMDPGIDGLETYRRIKAFRPDQKAIIASGFSRTRQVKEAMALGAGQYLKKPYTLEEIGLAVQRELRRN
ncbi:MAG: response regulator [Desulfobacter sp.]|nr:MAG: response regulator [Desulfobacter sp.]